MKSAAEPGSYEDEHWSGGAGIFEIDASRFVDFRGAVARISSD